MNINKWAKLRIFIVLTGIFIWLFILFLRFMYLQIGGRAVLFTCFTIVFIIILSLIIGHFFLQLTNKSYNLIKLLKNEIRYHGGDVAIIDLLVANKLKRNTIAFIIFFIALLSNIFITNYYSYSIYNIISLLILIMMIAILINQRIIEYRVRNKFYGDNEYEAREILSFIFDNSSNPSINSGMKIFPNQAILEELYIINEIKGIEGIKE